MIRQPRPALPALTFTALLLAACASADGVEPCSEDTLPGTWRAAGSGNLWIFDPDGGLSCRGTCAFTAAVGQPIAWAYEPHANIWSQPIDRVKLIFANATFDGVFGSFRCKIADEGTTLRLETDEGEAMLFARQ